MINRRYPIQSILAERKLFANGGMVSPQQPQMQMQQPQMPMQMQQPMQPMQPMQPPPQMQQPMQPPPPPQPQMQQPTQSPAQGIMASSQPLVDAIVADALNPEGGGTLSADDGTLSMAHGGLASEQMMAQGFSNGGLYTMESLQNPTMYDIEQYRDLYGKADLARRKAIEDVRPTRNLVRPMWDTLTKTRMDVEKLEAERDAVYKSNEIKFEKLKQIPLDTWLKHESVGASDQARQWFSNPENVKLVSASGLGVIPVSPYSFSDDLIDREDQEEGRQMLAAAAATDLPAAAATDLPVDAASAADHASLIRSKYQTMPEDAVKTVEEAMILNPDTSIEDIVSASFPPDMVLGFIGPDEDPYLDDLMGHTAADEAAYVAASRQPTEAPSDAYGRTTGLFGDLTSDEDSIEALQEGAVKQLRDTLSNRDVPADETKKLLKDYMDDFKNAMPEYKGMSEEEKGWALLEASFRIMAGQSPNAITNIANGLKGLGPQFAKDAKEKRAWKRQVDLSAAKYALAAVNKDTERLLAFERSENDLVQVMSPKTGDLKSITKADLRVGNIPDGYLITTDPYKNWIDGIKATKNLIVARAKAARKGELTAKWLGVGKNYVNNAQKVLDSVQSKTLLGPAIKYLFATGIDKVAITGFRGVLNTSWNRLQNAIGLDSKDTVAKKGEKREMYISRVQAVIAKKITAILGESNRTVSTPDRARADDIAGVFADYLWDPAFKDPDVLRDKLKILWQTLDNDERLGLAGMALAEQTVGDLTVPGGGMRYVDVLTGQRRALLGSAVGVGPKGKVRKLTDFGYDIKTGTWAK